MYGEPVQTEVALASKAITDEPTRLYWVFVEPLQIGTKGILKVRDGHSTSDKEVARIVSGNGRMAHFNPSIRCAAGLYIEIDGWVSSYTVGYLIERLVKE